ncbi:cupredoxin family copper-binding protein [Burkholderia sp. BKH01]|uniref:cupredoxin domain-containing protein n=1 Tax=Burkholderia sp. BKH01 TaxID=2769262 RepID=UPI00398BC485
MLWRSACRFVIVAATAGAYSAVAATHTVTIEGMRFNPDSLTVEHGDKIVWVNKDLVAHTATAAHAFDSHEIKPDASWTYVAREPGRYAYVCTLHPAMKATLTVKGKR